MHLTLSDKVVVVTGAAQGQGRREVDELVSHGVHVVAADVRWPSDMPQSDLFTPMTMDVAREDQWNDLAAEVKARFRRIDGLVNNAGVSSRTPLGSVGSAEFDKMIDVNVKGPLFAMQALTPLMPSGSSIVNVGSIAAVTAFGGVAYTASKWALRGLSRVASMHYGDDGIRVNLVNPGLIQTAMAGTISPAYEEVLHNVIPLKRFGVPADIAHVVTFLLSEESGYLSGAEINVDGGYAGHGGMKPGYDTWNVRGNQ